MTHSVDFPSAKHQPYFVSISLFISAD